MAEDLKQSIVEVKNAFDIADYVASFQIDLKGSANSLKGLCPFHKESTPSFSVDRNFQTFRCFGCGVHGDIISFCQRMENLDFMDALTRLAEEKGIEIHRSDSGGVSRKEVKECVKKAAIFFLKRFRELEEDHPAKQEVLKRGLSMDSMKYGYAPEKRNSLYNYLKSQNIDDEIIFAAGVCLKTKNDQIMDRWTGRLMFTIGDINGNPVGFSGKKLLENDKMGKYVNSPDGILFNKGRLLFNASGARVSAGEEGVLHVAEGQFDVVALKAAGLPNSVAALGTAFTKDHADMCKRMVNNGKIVFCFDGDEPGIEAALKVFKNQPSIHPQSFVVLFPEGADPCDYRQEHGDDAMVDFINSSQVPLVEFVLRRLQDSYNLSSEMGRLNYLEDALTYISAISNSSMKSSFIRKVSLRSQTPVEDIKRMLEGSESTKREVSSSPAEEEEDRPVISDGGIEDEILSKIAKSRSYKVGAYLVGASFRSMSDDEDLNNRITSALPKGLSGLFAEGVAIFTSGSPIIPEATSMPKLASYILSPEMFPDENSVDYDVMSSLRNKNLHRMEKIKKEALVKKIRRETAKMLESGESESAEYLISLMREEKKRIEQLLSS